MFPRTMYDYKIAFANQRVAILYTCCVYRRDLQDRRRINVLCVMIGSLVFSSWAGPEMRPRIEDATYSRSTFSQCNMLSL